MSRNALTFLMLLSAAPLAAQTPAQVEEATARAEEATARVAAVRGALTVARQRADMPARVFGGPIFGMGAVSYVMHATLQRGLQVPMDVVSAVRNDENLMGLNVNSVLGSSRSSDFMANFSFESLEEFDAWYASEATRDLHRALEAAAIDGTVEVNLSVNNMARAARDAARDLVTPEADPVR